VQGTVGSNFIAFCAIRGPCTLLPSPKYFSSGTQYLWQTLSAQPVDATLARSVSGPEANPNLVR